MEMNEMRRRLVEQRKRLQKGRDRSESRDEETGHRRRRSEELSTLDQHPADPGTETLERERAVAIIEQIDDRIDQVDAALSRLDEGRFGKCEVCGSNIPDERLMARPEARFCVQHQEEIERGERAVPPG